MRAYLTAVLLVLGGCTMANIDTATFAGGCFWCIEAAFSQVDGVKEVISGYTGGTIENPSYEQVSSGSTGHVEAVQVLYDPEKISYEELLDIFWQQIDPTDADGQFVDRGSQYKTAIFYHNQEQKEKAEKSRDSISGRFNKEIATEIRPAGEFYKAEEYHQDYYKKNKKRYALYKKNSGRDNNTKKTRNDLTPLQYKVTQEGGTELPFANRYWNNKKEGIYVDIVSGKPLFSSKDKFQSGTGWPSFTQPLVNENIIEKEDRTLGMKRTEVRTAESHLGHVFEDGPDGGRRYCINSAALRFIPKEDLEEEGYGEYKNIFE